MALKVHYKTGRRQGEEKMMRFWFKKVKGRLQAREVN